MSEHFDAIVIGSGFGGSVMAHKLAKGGLRVCILERGDLHPPGSFPRTPDQFRKAFWDPSKGLYGMYSLWSFRHFDALVSSAVGGGSLIYANVLERKPEEWFEQVNASGKMQPWPITFSDLEPHYKNVEKVLKPVEYPSGHAPYDATPKMLALKEAAAHAQLQFKALPLAVSFGNSPENPIPGEQLTGPGEGPEGNIHGVNRYSCRLCGECYQGCNYGSKNTLDLNYLKMAQIEGSQLRHLTEVLSFRRLSSSRYELTYRDLKAAKANAKNSSKESTATMTCDYLVLAAGAIGSPYLLMKNKEAFPDISPRLGQQFSGNGDLLTVVLHCKEADGSPKNIQPSVGPVITSAAISGLRTHPEANNPNARFYIEDWSYTATSIWLLDSMNIPAQICRYIRLAIAYIKTLAGLRRNTNLSADVSAVFAATDGSTSTFPMAGMGLDSADGKMEVDERNFLQILFPRQNSQTYFKNIKTKMKLIKESLRSPKKLIDKPSWYLGKTVTVHPLGGCPMGLNKENGVVNTYGEVFEYPNFYIADGSVLPAAIGPNPSLTIAALADRFGESLVAKRHKALRKISLSILRS